jgi:hypothetical protein
MVDKPKFSWSFDGELYHGEFDSREEAIADARENYPSKTAVHTGRNERITIEQVVGDLSDEAMEGMACRATDLAGESAEGFPWDDCDEAAQKELGEAIAKVILEWAQRHNVSPRFWTVVDVQQHQLS